MFGLTWPTWANRTNVGKAVLAALLTLGAIIIAVLAIAFVRGDFNSPAAPTITAPAIGTGTPGGGSGGMANGGVIIDLYTCTVKNEDGTTSPIDNCTPASAVESMDPYTQPSPGLNDNDVVEVPGECGVIHEYPLEGLPEVATSGNFIHVEHYDASKPGDPEVESVLDHARYGVNGFLKGYVWEYSIECSLDEVMAKVDAQIKARQDAGENNAGLASQEVTDARFSFIDDNGIPWGSFDPNRANPDSPKCQVMKEYPLAGRSKLSTEGAFIHVEHYIGGEPERESILSGDSTWKVEDGAKGFVWEYGKACKWGQVRDQITRHIKARLADHANNAGWIAWNNPAINGRFTAVR